MIRRSYLVKQWAPWLSKLFWSAVARHRFGFFDWETDNAQSKPRWLEDLFPGPQIQRPWRLPDLMERQSAHRACAHEEEASSAHWFGRHDGSHRIRLNR
jgi:hypothetical protein